MLLAGVSPPRKDWPRRRRLSGTLAVRAVVRRNHDINLSGMKWLSVQMCISVLGSFLTADIHEATALASKIELAAGLPFAGAMCASVLICLIQPRAPRETRFDQSNYRYAVAATSSTTARKALRALLR